MRKLIIPDAVKIAGITYDVKKSDIVILDNKTTWLGKIEYNNALIEILNSINEQRQFETFFHEVVHGILHESGYDEHDEDMVDKIGKVLYQILKDNYFYSEVGEVV